MRTAAAKASFSSIAWSQPAITDAAVTFIIIGQLADASVIPERLAPLVAAGVVPARDGARVENPAAICTRTIRNASGMKPCAPARSAQRQ